MRQSCRCELCTQVYAYALCILAVYICLLWVPPIACNVSRTKEDPNVSSRRINNVCAASTRPSIPSRRCRDYAAVHEPFEKTPCTLCTRGVRGSTETQVRDRVSQRFVRSSRLFPARARGVPIRSPPSDLRNHQQLYLSWIFVSVLHWFLPYDHACHDTDIFVVIERSLSLRCFSQPDAHPESFCIPLDLLNIHTTGRTRRKKR